MNIYIYDGPFEKGEKGYALIKRAIGMYCLENEMYFEPANLEIGTKEKGKPYLAYGCEMGKIEFSLSHSGSLWMCLVGDCPCGLDVQIEKPCSFEEIAKKFFTHNEQHYVELWGSTGFYELWVRREAFGKVTGEGFHGKMPEFVTCDCDLADSVELDGQTYFFSKIEIADDIKCAICTTKQEQIEIRSL